MEKQLLYDRLKDIHSWRGYYPKEPQHSKYETNLIFAGIKIADIYVALCTARANLHYYELDNYGDISSPDQVSKLFVKTIFIQNALIYYNTAADFSWQFLWEYYDNTFNERLPTEALYQKSMIDCTYDELLLGLTIRQYSKVRDYVKRFFNKNQAYLKIRPLYNYLKHRGTFYVEGLGGNATEHMFAIGLSPNFFSERGLPVLQKINIPLVPRRELDLEETYRLLEDFDNAFVKYCEDMFAALMPSDYIDTTCSLEQMIGSVVRHLNELVEYNTSR